MSNTQDKQPIEFIRLPEVKKLTSLSTATIYRMAVSGKFPRQVKLGDQAVAWIKSEVLAWNQQKVDDARAAESPAAPQMNNESKLRSPSR
ncbi:helix-turn-helix transcriptional regulator [Pseudomonas mohnii]